jgi:hypothetical protein
MKKLAVLLVAVLICGTAMSQVSKEVIVKTYLSLAKVDSLYISKGSAILYSYYKSVDSIETSTGDSIMIAPGASFTNVKVGMLYYSGTSGLFVQGDTVEWVSADGDSLEMGVVAIDGAANQTVIFRKPEFGSAVVGQQVYGPGIPFGTTISAITDTVCDAILTLSNRASSARTLDSLNIGYFSAAAYSSGDWLGLPFVLDLGPSAYLKLENVTVADTSDDFGNFDIALFRVPDASYLDTGLDNDPATLNVADMNYLIAYITVSSVADLGTVRFLTTSVITQFGAGARLYGRLVSKATPTFNASINPALLRFRFSQ